MNKIKITVMRKARYDDLIEKFENPIEHACDLKEGQVFVCEGWQKPDGFCDEAWKAIYQYVFALAHGASELWYYSDWINTPGVAIVSCNDGLRPVIMKLEATDIESNLEN